MLNLLPNIKKSISDREESKNDGWRPADAHPIHGKVSHFLESEFTKNSSAKVVYGQNILPMKEPNDKHRENGRFVAEDDTLKEALCEIVDEIKVSFVPRPSLTKKLVLKDHSSGNCLVVKVINTSPLGLDLFIQKKTSISNFTVQPMKQCVRYGLLTNK